MSIRNEHDLGNIGFLGERERDRDIHALSAISSRVNVSGMHFILTGSYAIEALTGNRLQHDDIDANIFTPNPVQDIQKATILIKKLRIPENRFSLYKKTANRLEYDLEPVLEPIAPRRLEIQFVEVASVSGDRLMEFSLKSKTKDPIKISTVLVPLKDSDENEFIFRVKSLPFAIATWAIRISGFAHSPKRPVRPTDLEQFRLLLTKEYSRDEVALAMKYHPQMPKDITEDQVFERALAVFTERE